MARKQICRYDVVSIMMLKKIVNSIVWEKLQNFEHAFSVG